MHAERASKAVWAQPLMLYANMCLLAVSIQAEVRDLQERLAIEKEAWEENYMKKQVCVKYVFVFILFVDPLPSVNVHW